MATLDPTLDDPANLPSATHILLACLPEAILVLVAALVVFGSTMPTLITFEDAGLFDSVCYTNGIAHPPGYPLFTLICAPLFQLPFEPATIGNSISAVFGALTCATLVYILRALHCSRAFAAFGGLLLAVSSSFWSQAIIVEVYTLNTFLFALVLLLCILFSRAPGRRLVWTITLIFSLGMSNHWPLMVLAFPGLTIIALSQWDWIRRQLASPGLWAGVLAAIAIGLSPYLSLLLKQHPLVSYSGRIDGLAGLFSYFMRESYASVDQQVAANITDKVAYMAWLTGQGVREISAFALPLALPALLTGHRTSGWPIHLGIIVIFLLNTLGLVVLLGFDYEFIFAAVFRPYLLIAWFCLVIWIALGMQWLAGKLVLVSPGMPAVAWVLSVFLLILTFFQNYGDNDRANNHLAHDYSLLVLNTLDRNAALVVSSDTQVFPLLYQHVVKGIRPDVSLFHIRNLIYPGKLAGATMAAHVASARALGATRPLYSIGVQEMPFDTDFGLFVKHAPPVGGHVARDNRHAEFRRRLIADYVDGNIAHAHDRFFASQLILAFGNQLLALGRLDRLNREEMTDLVRLQTTFVGSLATLYFALVHPEVPMAGDELVALAFRMEESIPQEASSNNRALFHYYFAQLFLRGSHGIKVDRILARQLLLKSFEELPTPDTPGLCTLLQLGVPEGHLANTEPFRERCA